MDPSAFFNSTSVTAIGVAFWIFLAIVVTAGCWLARAAHQATQETIRHAIDKGVRLDEEVIKKLLTRRPGGGSAGKPRDWYISGIIVLAVGIGLGFMGYFFGQFNPKAFNTLLGIAIMIGFVGVGLIGAGLVVWRSINKENPK